MTTATMTSDVTRSRPLLPWIVTFSASLFFFYIFIQMNMFNSLEPYLMKSYGTTAQQLGNLSAYFYYANVLFLFPAGIMLDRFSIRKTILVALFVSIVGTLFFGLSTSLLWASVFRAIAGIGAAFCFLSCMKLAARWFPPHRLAFVTGLIVTVAMLGGLVAQTPMTLLVEQVGLSKTILLDAALGAVIFFLIWAFVRDYAPGQDNSAQTQEALQALGFWKSIGLALKNRQNWFCGLYTSFLNLPIMILGALWGETYLNQVHNLSLINASYATGAIFLGTIVGSPVAGWISDHMGRRTLPMAIGAVLSLATVYFIMYLPNPSFAMIYTLFLLLGFFTSTQVIGYPTIAESNPPLITGTALGVGSFLIIGGGAVFQPLFGKLMDLHWDGTILNGVSIYSHGNFHLAFMILPIAFIVGLVLSFLIKETRCKSIV